MDSICHEFATKNAIEMSKVNMTEEEKTTLIQYSTRPDQDEIEGAYKYHFYNPATGLNFRGEEETALTKFYKHYNNAKELKAYKKDYGEELGRAVHFLQDICTPVHTYYEDIFDAATRLKQHVNFEKRCNDLCDTIKFNHKRYLNNTFNTFFKVNNIIDISKHFASKSSVLFDQYDKDSKLIDEIGKQSIHNVIIATTGIMLKFIDEGVANEYRL